ncbi:DUF3224 domain-containing protein [Aquitalea sp.]|uniref:DUF3224 domain-containing protein n=1 Tax=Aquitalea sp. TaxID=1872623 RepID=UPI00258C9680|nr:DUF3224 domain-containing protein [Aquitalea sp.]
MQAKGKFDVTLAVHPAAPGTEAAQLNRRAIHKTFHGDLEAVSLGEMLASNGTQPGSAGYVALERVEGRLAGRAGSFALMHFGVMAQGQRSLTVQLVPDSGTGELQGLSGTMEIDIRDGQHYYQFEYQFTPS